MSTRENYGVLFPTSVVGSMPRPDFVREMVLGEGSRTSALQAQSMDAAVA